jgi:hypothetical protein
VSVLDLFREQRYDATKRSDVPATATGSPSIGRNIGDHERISVAADERMLQQMYFLSTTAVNKIKDSDVTDNVQGNGSSNLVASYSCRYPSVPNQSEAKDKETPGTGGSLQIPRETIHVFPPRERMSSYIPNLTFLDDVLGHYPRGSRRG